MNRRRPAGRRLLRWPLPSLRDLDQATVGLVALVLFAGLVAGAFVLGTAGGFGDHYALSAVFRSTGGMEAGAVVRLAGVDVGSVTGIHPDFGQGQVVVTFEVDSGVDLGPSTRAEIAATTLLGGYHLRLTGPVHRPYLADLPGDDPRRRIPLDRTRAPSSLVGTLGDTTEAIEGIDIDGVNEVLRRVAGATDRNVEVLPELIDVLGQVAEATTAREAEIRGLVERSDHLLAAVADRDTELVQLLDAASTLLDTLAARRDQLATVLGSGDAAVQRITRTLAEHRDDLEDFLAGSHVVLDAIGRNAEVVNRSLAEAGTIFTLLSRVRSELGGFDVSVEGLVVNDDQLRGLLGILFPELAP